jgi:hypothetical protein
MTPEETPTVQVRLPLSLRDAYDGLPSKKWMTFAEFVRHATVLLLEREELRAARGIVEREEPDHRR